MNGRELSSYQDNTNNITYKYNLDGIRTSKIVNGIETKYYLEGSSIIFEDRNGNMIYYIYNGDELLGFIYNSNTYYYHKNIFGDIIGILDSNYNEVVTYTYNSWGLLTNKTDTTTINLSTINPFRYRSYYYDEETNLYYLNSRYYNPEWGRFVTSDIELLANQDIISANLYQYVSNNSVVNYDKSGRFILNALAGILIGKELAEIGAAVAGAIASAATTVLVGAIAIAGISAISTSISKSKTKTKSKTKKSNNSNNNKKHTVYALVDESNMAKYIGRTNNPPIRSTQHSLTPSKEGLTMRIIKSDLNYLEARGVEQMTIEYCNTLNKNDLSANQRNEIKIGTENYYNLTRMGSLAFDTSIIPVIGDQCYIDPSLYPAVK